MKKILLLFVALIAFVATSFSQNVISKNSIVVRGGSAIDTAQKNQAVSQIFIGSPFIQDFAFEAKTTKKSGTYQKARVFIEKSYDKATWYTVDTLAIASSSTTVNSNVDIQAINAPYVRLRLLPYDSTQVIKYKYSTAIKID